MRNYFSPKEWLPKDKYTELKKAGLIKYADRFIDDRALYTANQLREYFGVTYANTWGLKKIVRKVYGIHQWRGWRPMDCPVGAKVSGHKFTGCLDLVFVGVSAQEVREYIIENKEKFPYIIEMESDISWLHFRVGNRDISDDIILIPRY